MTLKTKDSALSNAKCDRCTPAVRLEIRELETSGRQWGCDARGEAAGTGGWRNGLGVDAPEMALNRSAG